jgi:hypothetical protein
VRGPVAQRRDIISHFFAILIDPTAATIIFGAETKNRSETAGGSAGWILISPFKAAFAMKKLLLAVAIAALISNRASAVLVLDDNFDSYANQAAFQAAWPAIGSSTTNPSALLSTTQSASAPNSINVPGTLANNEYRNRRSFGESGTISIIQNIVWSFDFFDSAPAANPQRNYSNLQDTTAPSATNQLIAMGMNNNQTAANSGGNRYMARILGYTVPTTADPDGGATESVGGTGAFFKLNDFGSAGLRSAGWHNFKVVMSTDNGTSTDYSFYVDNVLAERVSNVGTLASMRSFDNVVIGSGLSNASTEAFFDNMRLELVAVPEIGSFAAMGFVGLLSAGALWIRKRRAAA